MTNITNIWYLCNNFTLDNLLMEDVTPLQSYLDKYYIVLAIITIVILVTAWYMVFMITLYERFGMDTMKRGLINRLVSSFLNFGLISIVVFIIEEFDYMLINRNPGSKIFYGFNQIFFVIGSLLVLNQIILWKYLTKKIFKRIPSFNHDFIGLWLEISSIVITFILSGAEAHGDMFHKMFNKVYFTFWPFYPKIR